MAETIKYLCDTSVLIDYLRGDQSVKEKLLTDQFVNLSISSITLMELFVGAFNKQEVEKIRKAFEDITIIELNEEISIKARALIEQYTKSHNLQIPDALIASTALFFGIPLYTKNISDFRYIHELKLVDT
jgi:predicted nucleic acid-binding protein